MRVLIIDDHVGFRRVLKDYLLGLSCEVVECENGRAAIRAFSRHRPDWVTMDVEMPGIGGIEASAILKHNFPEARIVILTQHDEPALRALAHDAGVHHYLLKENLFRLREIIAPGL